MAEKSDISTALKRKLKAGKEYDKLIPRVSCQETPLGEGDTFYTVDQMRTWIEKYRWQTAKLALKLQGRSLEETVNNIYRFLYDHVQYTADGALQQLRSPACTWAHRKQGTDCKSYSVFASSILLNLGIKHAIRQVRQPYFYPEEFTHVYVVIPVDQSVETISENAPTFVIDATKHQNTEVEYIQKADLVMNKLAHVGLNAPQNERTKNIIENFEKFSKFLIQKGISVATVNAMRQEVNKYTSKGLDPKFNIVDEGLVIQGKFFRLNFPDNGLNFAVTGAAAVTAGKSIIGMLPPNFLGDTFGAIFANGFDFSCWNSANSPTKAQGIITEEYMPFLEEKMAQIENPSGSQELISAINDLIRFSVPGYWVMNKLATDSKYAKCSREGWQVQADFLLPIKTKMEMVLKGLERDYNIQTQKRYITGTQEFSHSGGTLTLVLSSKHNPNVPITTLQSISGKTNYGGGSTGDNTGGSTGGGGSTPGGGSNYQPGTGNGDATGGNGGATAKKSSNTGIIVGGVALAAIPFLLPMIKKSK